MTTLNINQPYFAAMITDSGERIELGKAVWPQIQERAFANLKAIDEDISAAMIEIGRARLNSSHEIPSRMPSSA